MPYFAGENLQKQRLKSELNETAVKNRRLFTIRTAAVIAPLMIIAIMAYIFSGRYTCSYLDILHALGYGITDMFISLLELPARIFPGIDYEIVNPIAVTWQANVDTLLWIVRVPRMAAVFFVGGGLAIAGANYQATFQNPLVSESILGVSAGASLGACVGIFFSMGTLGVSAFAFAGGILAVALTCFISKVVRGNPTLLLVLAGTVVSGLFSAGVSILKYIVPDDEMLADITFWMMGSFANIQRQDLLVLIPAILVCTVVLFRIRWKLNVLALGDDSARALGVNTKRLREVIIMASTMISAVSVCECGMIGWIGAVIPQIIRMLIGPDMQKLVPVSFFAGGIFLLLADLLCRTLLITEIPIGIVTSLLGAPIYLLMLKRAKEGWN